MHTCSGHLPTPAAVVQPERSVQRNIECAVPETRSCSIQTPRTTVAPPLAPRALLQIHLPQSKTPAAAAVRLGGGSGCSTLRRVSVCCSAGTALLTKSISGPINPAISDAFADANRAMPVTAGWNRLRGRLSPCHRRECFWWSQGLSGRPEVGRGRQSTSRRRL